MNRTSYLDRNLLPKISAVYLVFSGALCLYVGSSENICKRLRKHSKAKEFEAHKATHIEWVECAFEKLGALEAAVVFKNKPTLNSYASRSKTKQNRRAHGKHKESSQHTTLRDRTLKLLHSRVYSVSLSTIATECGITESWLGMFSRGAIADPSVNKIECLYAYLNGAPLKLDSPNA